MLLSSPGILGPAGPQPDQFPAAIRALLIEGNPDDALLISELLADLPGEPIALDWMPNHEAGQEAMSRAAHDLYLIDHQLCQRSGLDLSETARAAGRTLPVILLLDAGDPMINWGTLQASGATYLVKGEYTATLLGHAIRTVLGQAELAASPHSVQRAPSDTSTRKAIEDQAAIQAQMLAQVPTALMTTDLTGRVTYWNRQAEALYGWSATETSGRLIGDLLVGPAEVASAKALFAHVLTGQAWAGEFAMRRKDGTTFPAYVHGAPLYATDGAVVGLVGTAVDLSAHRAVSEALREAERKYRILVEQTPAVTYITPLDLGKAGRYCSPQLLAMTGYSPAAWASDPALRKRLLYPPDRARIARANKRSAETKSPFREEYRLVRQDGQVIWVRDEATLVRDEHGEARFWQGLLLDITDLKQATALANGQRQVLELLVQGAPLVKVLETLARLVESHSTKEARCSIYLVDPTGTQLDLAAAPSLPADYCRLFTAVPIGPASGSCGTAASRKETVVVTDIATDPLWADYYPAALAHNLRACWSVPILSGDGRVLGTFATYYREPRAPDDRIIELLGITTRLAGVAIERTEAREALGRNEARFRSLVQHSSDIITIVEKDGTIRYESPAITAVLGYTPEEVLGVNIFAGMHREDMPSVHATFGRSLRKPGVIPPVTVRMRHRDGSWRYLEAIGNNLLADPSVRGIVITARDVTARREAEAALRLSESRLAEAQRIGHLGSWEYDCLREELRWSDEVFRIGGYAPQAFIPTITRMIESVHPDDRDLVSQALQIAVDRDEPYELDYRIVRPDGEIRVVHQQAEIIRDPAGRPLKWLGIVLDITAQRALEERLAHQAFHDTLTGLPNRALFLDRLTQALARTETRGCACAVLFLDLDHFKDINDTLGHVIGDQLLVAVATRLRATLAAEQTLARLGGDEFTVLVDDHGDLNAALAVAERLLRAFDLPFPVGDRILPISTSIGIVLSVSGRERPEDLLRDADIAMYRAKETGKGRYAVFDACMQQQLVERLALEQDLQRALAHDEFVLHYQPIIDLRTDRIVEAEALLRWQHPTRGLVPPTAFLPLAEKIGLIRPLGRWVLRAAARQARAWQIQGRPLKVAANLTANEFQQPTLVAEVADVLAEVGLDPCWLRLEITESVAMNDAAATSATLTALRELGVQVAIDDFGTGYSSLAYLQRLPVDALKIDRGFVRALDTDPASLTICRSVTLLAHALGLQVTAEGIETATQAAQLRELGCDQAQGYYFARPVPAADLTARLATAGMAP